MANLLTEKDSDQVPDIVDLATDWYIPVNNLESGFAYPGPHNFSENERLFEVAEEIMELCQERAKKGKLEFSINNNGRSFRVHKIESVTGIIFAVRRIPNIIPDLSDLGLPKSIVSILSHEKLKKGGLVIISGETGQGKSTTTGATIKARLKKFTSFCLTIEDPVELPLHGDYDNGKCIQTEIDSGGFPEALKGAVRSYPAMSNCILYVGEARDPETAYQSLIAASNGHLVFTTLHAYDIQSSIHRFLSLASSYKNASEDVVYSLFANSFRLILNQELKHSIKSKEYRLRVKALFNATGKGAIAEHIKNNQISSLSTDIERQADLIRKNDVKNLFND